MPAATHIMITALIVLPLILQYPLVLRLLAAIFLMTSALVGSPWP